ncbi:MAG: UDP-N-acetylmuramoyl-L-alanyl-D-glutamate--2,6-diaminopimelate ligase [Phycisphaerae bacterium]|nr:UDP-N-acetylmuramoyl-L-alanyl-D-glutamate--2,6-diaminopimelate ligase [Phycisphaerae bacterium]
MQETDANRAVKPVPVASSAELLARALSAEDGGGVPDFPVRGIACDSREVGPGYVFVAVCGTKTDGAAYARQAVAAGAQLVISHRVIEDLGCPQIVLDDPRAAVAKLAAAYYGLDRILGREVKLVGVTGTNGKTTVTYIFQHICRAAGLPCARMGTIEYDLLTETVTASHTTPGPVEVCRLVRQAVDNGAKLAVMEVSSHALAQARVAGLSFATGVFTNISGDHLDYHKTMEAYLTAKGRLFEGLGANGAAVVNRDDPNGARLLGLTRARPIGYGIETKGTELWAEIREMSSQRTAFDVHFGQMVQTAAMPFIGRHNVYNALAALGAAISVGIEPGEAILALESLPPVPGRLERVAHRGGFDVFVDYAHTDDGLENVMRALRPITRGRLIVVFGCGGDRDRTKRPRMAAVAERLGDLVVVTSDNPRTEDPAAIIDDILKGFSTSGLAKTQVESDRTLAIRAALTAAQPGDVVLIAGKGHEDYQIVGTVKHPFDDRVKAAAVLGELGHGG